MELLLSLQSATSRPQRNAETCSAILLSGSASLTHRAFVFVTTQAKVSSGNLPNDGTVITCSDVLPTELLATRQ